MLQGVWGPKTLFPENEVIKGPAGKADKVGWVLAPLLVLVTSALGREQPQGPAFKYVGGTEKLEPACEGKLEVTSTALVFNCPKGSIAAPYDSIFLMQYRPDVSRKVWKMKLKWKVRPLVESPLVGKKRNRYFTILYTEKGATHAMILDVSANAMRPYLAEIDLKAGKRVEVKGYEEYD